MNWSYFLKTPLYGMQARIKNKASDWKVAKSSEF